MIVVRLHQITSELKNLRNALPLYDLILCNFSIGLQYGLQQAYFSIDKVNLQPFGP